MTARDFAATCTWRSSALPSRQRLVDIDRQRRDPGARSNVADQAEKVPADVVLKRDGAASVQGGRKSRAM